MSIKKYIVNAALLIVGSVLVVEYLHTPLFIFYGGVFTVIIIDIVKELIE